MRAQAGWEMAVRKVADLAGVIKKYPEHFTRQRRNLLAASTLGIIYGVGGGSVGGDVSGMIAVIHLERPEILEIAGYSVFFYFLWRYWVFCPGIRSEYDKNISQILMGFDKFRTVAEERSWEEFKKKPHWEAGERGFGQAIRKAKVSALRSTLVFEDQSFNGHGRTMNLQKFSVDLPWYISIPYGLRATLEHAIKWDLFSEYMLPYIMAATAVVMLGANHF